ncbi:hypothetical protein GCM10011519_27250 [Marmoricola endophyticus]|uniref:Glycosyltransferase 2-like domain-containing protein n=1 Tax=Marmoricola endophyticus TaxID=2040280 RepID=A0A917F7S4_9ACTN|nr:hypothetical protein GCM10011519_27250 [Marmoricola endophyticus]
MSVVIPVRNGADWIDEQLTALAAQDFDGTWEVVIADNGSTDDTRERVGARADAFPVRLRVVDAGRRPGISHARNTGLLASTAPLVAFCDADDRADSRWLSAAVGALADLEVVSGETRLLGERAGPEAEVLDLARAVVGCNFAVRRATYLEIGGMDEGLPPYGCEEFELAIRAEAAHVRIGVDETMVMFHRPTEGFTHVVTKIYRSATAEAVVWQRHPTRFADRLRLRYPVGGLLRLPALWLADVRAGRGFDRRAAARRVVTLVGNIAGLVLLRRGAYAEPVLIREQRA